MAYQMVKGSDSVASDDELPLYGANDSGALPPKEAQFTDWRTYKSRSRILHGAIMQLVLIVLGLLLCAIGILNLLTLRSTLAQQRILNAQHSNGFAETLPKPFGSDRRFMSLEHKFDHLWEGWSADAQIMVPSEIAGEGDIQGAFSMFHQMHCLASMRRAIQAAREGEDPGLDFYDDGHWPHCFDYLRQSIQCWADDTIEIATNINGTRLPYIDGSRVVRQCRTAKSMYERIRVAEIAVEQANRLDDEDEQAARGHRPVARKTGMKHETLPGS